MIALACLIYTYDAPRGAHVHRSKRNRIDRLSCMVARLTCKVHRHGAAPRHGRGRYDVSITDALYCRATTLFVHDSHAEFHGDPHTTSCPCAARVQFLGVLFTTPTPKPRAARALRERREANNPGLDRLSRDLHGWLGLGLGLGLGWGQVRPAGHAVPQGIHRQQMQRNPRRPPQDLPLSLWERERERERARARERERERGGLRARASIS